jgi:HK97 family phage major capsid protein
MKRSEMLLKQASEKYSECQKLMGTDGAALSPENAVKVDALLAEIDGLNTQAEQAKKAEALEAKFNTPAVSLPTGAKRAGDPDFASAQSPEDRPFKSLGEQLKAIRDYSTKKIYDPRFDGLKISGMNETIDDEGAILLQKDFAEGIFKAAFDTGTLASLVRRYPIAGNSMRIRTVDETSRVTGSRWGGVHMYWVKEGEKFDSSKLKFGGVDLKLNKLAGLWYVTEEALEDIPYMTSAGQDAFTDETAFMLDDAIWEGNGAGQPLGMFTSNAKIEVAKEAAQAADTVVAANVAKMFARMPTRSIKTAIWVYNPDVFPQLVTMTIGDVPVFVGPNGIKDAPFGTILGRPAFPFEPCSTVGDAGDIAFVDPKAYGMIQKGSGTVSQSMHVKFEEDEMAFKIKIRVDGAPLLKSAITPFKGSNSMSTIVTVAARA